VLDWLAAEMAIALETTTAIIHQPQPATAIDAVRDAVARFDDHELAAFAVMTQALGSVGLAFALAGGALDAEKAAEASQLDESYQSDLWGKDREAELRLRALRDDIAAADRYLALHRG